MTLPSKTMPRSSAAFACAVAAFLATGARAAPPENLCNWQNEHCCETEVLTASPKSVEDIQALVEEYDSIQGSGLGMSWNQPFFCPEVNQNAVGITTSTVEHQYIDIDEENLEVRVSAGVKTRDFIDYLASQGETGYALPTISWFIDQSIGGAVATGTHGSSMEYGSLSSEEVLKEITMVLSNGTLVTLSSETDPFLMKAARVSVGRLGIITSLKFKIKPQRAITRTTKRIGMSDFAGKMLQAQEEYLETGETPELFKDAGQWLIYPAIQQVLEITFEDEGEGSPIPTDYSPETGPVSASESGEPIPVDSWEEPSPFRPVMFAGPLSEPLVRSMANTGRNYMSRVALPNGTFPTRDAIITFPEEIYEASYIFGPTPYKETVYDQYEVGIPIETAGDCLAGLVDLMEDGEERYAFRTPCIVRPVSQEEGLLSISNDHPVVYINIEDYVFYNQRDRERNQGFYSVMRYLRGDEKCKGSRMHWGKAGWPDEGCWDGSKEYPDTWCDFGCAVRMLDPNGKFHSSSDVWDWEGSDLDRCCSESGYNHDDETCMCQVLDLDTSLPKCSPPGYSTY
eukprot:scaffold155_cov347-Pavlova_lutheri.AAC.35